jgi:hypothetical protein
MKRALPIIALCLLALTTGAQAKKPKPPEAAASVASSAQAAS